MTPLGTKLNPGDASNDMMNWFVYENHTDDKVESSNNIIDSLKEGLTENTELLVQCNGDGFSRYFNLVNVVKTMCDFNNQVVKVEFHQREKEIDDDAYVYSTTVKTIKNEKDLKYTLKHYEYMLSTFFPFTDIDSVIDYLENYKPHKETHGAAYIRIIVVGKAEAALQRRVRGAADYKAGKNKTKMRTKRKRRTKRLRKTEPKKRAKKRNTKQVIAKL
tara:strand:+ start:683 stop:1336 length:654 start_codon:yes stop_codon:yes gene_type:complete